MDSSPCASPSQIPFSSPLAPASRPCAAFCNGSFQLTAQTAARQEIWLVFGTRHESEIYYRDEFEALASAYPNFHYLPTLSRALKSGLAFAATCRTTSPASSRTAPHDSASLCPRRRPIRQPRPELRFDIYTYICGLNFMIIECARSPEELRLARKADHLRALRLRPPSASAVLTD